MNLGDRIKKYENVSKTYLLPKEPIFIRIDGKAFHSFTKKMEKPFDMKLIESMIVAGEKTAKEMMGFKIGYHQSDEFTFLLTDWDNFESQGWFNYQVQKICSVTASLFTMYFNKEMGGTDATFDCRCFNCPKEDFPNVFVWRQQDWERNSLQMFSRSKFSHKDLINKNMSAMHEMLFGVGENWGNLPDILKNGTYITNKKERIYKKLNYEEIQKLFNSLIHTQIT